MVVQMAGNYVYLSPFPGGAMPRYDEACHVKHHDSKDGPPQRSCQGPGDGQLVFAIKTALSVDLRQQRYSCQQRRESARFSCTECIYERDKRSQPVDHERQRRRYTGERDTQADNLAISALAPPLARALPGRPLAIHDQPSPVYQLDTLPVTLELVRQREVIDEGRAHVARCIPARCEEAHATQEEILSETECVGKRWIPHL